MNNIGIALMIKLKIGKNIKIPIKIKYRKNKVNWLI